MGWCIATKYYGGTCVYRARSVVGSLICMYGCADGGLGLGCRLSGCDVCDF
jgi:hypothetical protein